MDTTPWGYKGKHSRAVKTLFFNPFPHYCQVGNQKKSQGQAFYFPNDHGPTSLSVLPFLESKPTLLIHLEISHAMASWILKHSKHKGRWKRLQTTNFSSILKSTWPPWLKTNEPPSNKMDQEEMTSLEMSETAFKSGPFKVWLMHWKTPLINFWQASFPYNSQNSVRQRTEQFSLGVKGTGLPFPS